MRKAACRDAAIDTGLEEMEVESIPLPKRKLTNGGDAMVQKRKKPSGGAEGLARAAREATATKAAHRVAVPANTTIGSPSVAMVPFKQGEDEWTEIGRGGKLKGRRATTTAVKVTKRKANETSGVAKQATETEPKKGARMRSRTPRRPTSEAIAVKPQTGVTYADMAKKVMGATGEMKGLQTMRRARTGELLLEFQEKTELSGFKKVIERAVGSESVRTLQSSRMLELRGLDILTEESDLVADLTAALKLQPGQVTLRSMRIIERIGTRIGLFVVPRKDAANLQEDMKVRMGHVMVPIRIKPDVQRCFKCQRFGHVSYTCKEQVSGAEICRRCGTSGHRMEECQATPRCFLCAERKLPENRLRHIAGSAGCGIYKEALGKRTVSSVQ